MATLALRNPALIYSQQQTNESTHVQMNKTLSTVLFTWSN